MVHFIIRCGIWIKGTSIYLTSVVNFPAVNIKSWMKISAPPPPMLSEWSAKPPAGINLSRPRVLMARVPRRWGDRSFHRGWIEGNCLLVATAMGSMNKCVRRRWVIIYDSKKKNNHNQKYNYKKWKQTLNSKISFILNSGHRAGWWLLVRDTIRVRLGLQYPRRLCSSSVLPGWHKTCTLILKEFVHHSPAARDLRILLVFFQHPEWLISL